MESRANAVAQLPGPSDQRGAALLITLMISLIVFVLGTSLATNMLTEVTSSANYSNRGAALWQADSGLERVAVDLLANPVWARDMIDYSTIPMIIENPFPTTVVINGITVNFTSDGMGSVVPQYYPLGNTVVLDNGNFTRQIFAPPTALTPANGQGTKAWLMIPVGSQGNHGAVEPSTARLRSDMRIEVRRLTVWDNAIFGGAGQAGNSINGNVQVRGSIHVVGNPVVDTDQGGTAFVLNHYRGAGDADNFVGDAWKLPSVPTINYNGEIVESLDAEVRINDGDIDLSGSVMWGEQDVTGDGYKEELDGFYTDGNLNLSGSAEVNSTEYGGYDAAGMAFPGLDDPYYDAATSTSYASHRDYLDAVALVIPETEISDNVAAFAYSDANGNSIDWDPATDQFTITGIVKVAGDLDLARKNDPVYYNGTGTLYAVGDIAIHDHLMPTGNYLDTTAMNMNNLGLIADDDMNIATGGGETWVKVMAAIYANDTTTIKKQSRIAGAVVTNYFDLGTNVPRVFQAPRLSYNLPPGMPGADPLLFVTGADVTNWYLVRR